MKSSILSLLLLIACVLIGNYAANIPPPYNNLDQINTQLLNQPSSIDHNLNNNDQVDQNFNNFDHLLNELEQVSDNDPVIRNRRCYWGNCCEFRRC